MRINNYKTVLDSKTHMAYLVREKGFNYNGMPDRKCTCPEQIVDMMRVCYGIHRETEECLYLLCTDARCNLIGTFLVSKGTVDASHASPREILVKALLCNAVNIFLVHNHPSQEAEPSTSDVAVTANIKKAAELVGLTLQDHAIVCADTYYSFRKNGCIR